MRANHWGAWATASAVLFVAPSAAAQGSAQPAGAPLPPLPTTGEPSPSQTTPVPAPAPPPPASYAPPPNPDDAPNSVAALPMPPAPPPVIYVEPPPATHAPKYALFVGGRLGVIAFGNNFYTNDLGEGETTGNFVKSGLSLEVDVGFRFSRRYIPYLFAEHGFMGAGHRFDGVSASASSDFVGFGFRYIAGDVDSAGFLSDIAFGVRTITVKSGGDTYKMSATELFKLGLGAEIRFSTLFTISPMASLSGGVMTDTQGHVTFADGSHPPFQDGMNIQNQRGYLVVGLGCGGNFDFFGK